MPPSAIAEPPKPSPAPAPSPAPTPSPAPSPAPAPKQGAMDAFDDQFADLDAPPVAPAPKPTPEPKAEPGKPAAKPTPAAKAEPKAEPKAAPEPEPLGDDFEPPATGKPGDIRGWALRQGKRAKKAEEELVQLRGKLAQLEQSGPNGSDSKMLAEQLASAQKRLEEYENEVRLTKYERSNEYKEKWEQPYKKAVERAYRDVEELLVTVREQNPNDPDHPIERERQATRDDFNEVFQLPLGAATKKAKEKFGDAYALVLQHRKDIKQLQEGAYSAVQEYRDKGLEHEKQSEARTKQEQAFIESAWQKANESMRAKGAEYFDERQDDEEGNELLQKGMAHAELAFDHDALSRYPLPQQIAVHARIKNWAGAFPRLRRDVVQLRAQLAEAQATIEQLRGSGPGKPAPGSDPQPGTGVKKGLMEAFDEVVK